MGNLFDGAESTAFKIVTNTMGYDADWTPSVGGPTKLARVLYKDPAKDQKFEDAEYSPYEYKMEYEKGDFDGLKEAVDSGKDEEVNIDTRFGLKTFFVRKVKGKFDGATFVAEMEAKL